ncbi:MAG: response regulator [Archangium sp.]|nr:response regulator [Archangium sp.]
MKPTILCVDDEPNVLDVLCRMFDRLAIVLTARSGPEALAVLRSRPVDLLITDQKMPEMTGIELVREARKEGFGVTTILLTAYTNPNDLISAINEGQVFRYVTKPWDINDLTMTVRNALAVAQLRKEKERLVESLHKRIEALNVMYEVSRQSAKDAPSLDAIVDRLLATVGRVLPHDASAVLIESSDGETAALRIRCTTALNESALLHVKDSVLSAHRKAAGIVLPEERVSTNVSGEVAGVAEGLSTFACAISVPLVAEKQTVGTLALFSTRPDSYSTDDGELLDVLVNQTTDAITHVRAAEREARLRIEQMVEAMGDGVILTDAKGGVVVVNKAARELLKLSAEDTRPGFERLTAELGLSPFELVRGWEYGGAKTMREELRLHERDIELVVTPVAGAARELRGLVLVLRDVSEQKLLTQRKDEFVGIISHELRTPLTSIAGALDLVLNRLAGDITEKQKRFLTMARESTERLNALVDDLLDLAKFEQGGMRMDFQLMRLDELVKTAVERYGPSFSERKVEVSLDVTATDVKLLADPNRINQVINNLLTNAVKFTPQGGTVKVTVGRSVELPGSAVLSVWNSGESIAEADLERIFDRFEQARSAKTRSLPGTGLGLSICRTIVEGHGGRIWAETVGDGARFVAVFPEEPTDQQPAADEVLKVERGTVLVVEDEAQIAWLLKAKLLSAGFKVVVADRGHDALAAARRVRPDVITLDHRLPDVEGLKLLEILRHDPETKAARVLMVSGVDVREEALRAGAHAFLLKPLSTASFLSSVEALFKEHEGSRGRVLVVDDDPQITAICAEVLSNQGFDVDRAGSVAEATTIIARKRPELLLLDVSLPDGDGFRFFETLKADRAGGPMSVIFISARSDTSAKVRALKLGGDDYLTKPFDALELGARVESVLRRRTADTSASPTTQLPGSAAIEREVQRRLRERAPFAFCYLDLDNLKAFNDFYGFAKADGVVKQTADLLREVVSQMGDGSEFVGHVAGDDFVFILRPDQVDSVCRRVIESFDRIIPLYYERGDRERGYIEAEDRYGQRRRFPVMSVSIAAVMTDGTVDHPELARQAAELKKRAKAVVGSVVLRSDQPDSERSIA